LVDETRYSSPTGPGLRPGRGLPRSGACPPWSRDPTRGG